MMNAKQLALGLATTALLCMGIVSTASAQAEISGDGSVFALSSTSTTTTTGIGVTVAVIWLVSSPSATKSLDRYIAANNAEVRQGLAMGAGASTEDLANFFGVSQKNHAAFANMLRKERKTLQKAVSGKRDTVAFINHIKKNMRAHTTLSQDIARYTNG